MTTMFRHTFTPLRNGIVASEAAWKKPGKCERETANQLGRYEESFIVAYDGPRWTGPMPCCRVLVAGDDLFAESEGPIRDKDGDPLLLDGMGAFRKSSENVTNRDWPSVTLHHVRECLFALIDACPNLTFIVRTRHAENVCTTHSPPWWSGSRRCWRRWPSSLAHALMCSTLADGSFIAGAVDAPLWPSQTSH